MLPWLHRVMSGGVDVARAGRPPKMRPKVRKSSGWQMVLWFCRILVRPFFARVVVIARSSRQGIRQANRPIALIEITYTYVVLSYTSQEIVHKLSISVSQGICLRFLTMSFRIGTSATMVASALVLLSLTSRNHVHGFTSTCSPRVASRQQSQFQSQARPSTARFASSTESDASNAISYIVSTPIEKLLPSQDLLLIFSFDSFSFFFRHLASSQQIVPLLD